MRRGWRHNGKNRKGESCGNGGAVESVESQKQASHSFHQPLGNLANSRRDSHISTAPASVACLRQNSKQEKNREVWATPPGPSLAVKAGTVIKRFGGGAPRPQVKK